MYVVSCLTTSIWFTSLIHPAQIIIIIIIIIFITNNNNIYYKFNRGVQAIKQMIPKSKAESRYGVVTIATTGKIVLKFRTNEKAAEKLRMVIRSGGKTNTQNALEMCYQMFEDPRFGSLTAALRECLLSQTANQISRNN